MKEFINRIFKEKFPDKRYEFKTYYVIHDMYGIIKNDIYIVNFIDNRMKHPNTIELKITYNELKEKGYVD